MRVIVYVEGPSDQLAMQELLAPLLFQLQAKGTAVAFIPTGNKGRLMATTPRKAANILRNDPQTVVVAMPDLYPGNVGHPHRSPDELRDVLKEQFARTLRVKGTNDARLRARFKVFCFKHDLEALILAAEDELRERLGSPVLQRSWVIPVEDQDMDTPPKRIVEGLFRQYKDSYHDTVDAPLILGAAGYRAIADACPQCFAPFVAFLESLLQEV